MRERTADNHENQPARDRADDSTQSIPQWMSAALIEKTIRAWQPLYKSPLTFDDAVTILQSVGRLFQILSRTDRHEEICCIRAGEQP